MHVYTYPEIHINICVCNKHKHVQICKYIGANICTYEEKIFQSHHSFFVGILSRIYVYQGKPNITHIYLTDSFSRIIDLHSETQEHIEKNIYSLYTYKKYI